MNERFIRCSECGLPHEEGLTVCPGTGRAIVRAPVSLSRQTSPGRTQTPSAPPPRPPTPSQTPSVVVARGAQESLDFDLIGTLVGGKYRVRAVLGKGGMGTVYEALREGLGNLVAVKVLHPNQLQKRDAVQRFHHEARAAARIGHPNICEVYDVGTLDDGRPYLVMDRLNGVTLAERIESLGGLPFQDVLDTLTQVLSGLHAAHEKGIIHRDIKPENVFLSQRMGCPPLAKILDFGVSKAMTNAPGGGGGGAGSGFSDVEVTRTGVVLGTPYYLAPEQARGERNLDARVDLYACGVMLYEALTGRRPFRAPNYNALLIAILTTTPRPAREIRPDLPAGFGRILDKSMERDPAERFQTALEFQAALQPYSQNPLATRTKPPSRPPPRRSTGFPPAPQALLPSRVPGAQEDVETGDDLSAFLESSSSNELSPPAIAPPPRPASVAPPAFTPPPDRSGGARLPFAPQPFTPPPFVPRPATGAPVRSPPRPTPSPAPAPSAPPPARNPGTVAIPPVVLPPAPPPRTGSQNFDDQETEVDLPRAFDDASEPPAHPTASAERSISGRPSGADAFRPRRVAPVVGAPLQPPKKLAEDEDSAATEIMSAAIRSKLPDPPKKKELPPPPQRPPSTRPPRR